MTGLLLAHSRDRNTYMTIEGSRYAHIAFIMSSCPELMDIICEQTLEKVLRSCYVMAFLPRPKIGARCLKPSSQKFKREKATEKASLGHPLIVSLVVPVMGSTRNDESTRPWCSRRI